MCCTFLLYFSYRMCLDSCCPTVHNLDTDAGLARLKKEGVSMKEGSRYKLRISFRVQHELVLGIKFVNSKLVTLLICMPV
jgi:RHO protein GDP dissociation inhibitor